MPGLRWRADRIQVPTLIRDVAAARAPVIANALPEPLRRSLGWPPQQLIGHPDRVEPDRLGAEGEVPDLDPARRWTLDEHVPRREHQPIRTFSLDLRVGDCVLPACDHPARRSLDGQGHRCADHGAARRHVAARAYDATRVGAGAQNVARPHRNRVPRSKPDQFFDRSALHNAGPRLRAAGSRCVPGAVNGHPRDRWTCGR